MIPKNKNLRESCVTEKYIILGMWKNRIFPMSGIPTRVLLRTRKPHNYNDIE